MERGHCDVFYDLELNNPAHGELFYKPKLLFLYFVNMFWLGIVIAYFVSMDYSNYQLISEYICCYAVH